MNQSDSEFTPKNTNVMAMRIDMRWVALVLLVIIAVMLALWRPWQQQTSDSSRTISVTGEATVSAEPDEFAFYPSYEFKKADKTVALDELKAKQTDIVAGLKKLGVADSKIKSNASGYDYPYYYNDISNDYTYTLSLTITVNQKSLTQKVQDYLVSTSPTGGVSPNTQFSTTLQKKLESQARDKATKEARSKADQSAANLGFKVGKVKSVDDGGFGGGSCGGGRVCPMLASGSAMMSAEDSSAKSLTVQAGENDLSYSVSVVYYVQ